MQEQYVKKLERLFSKNGITIHAHNSLLNELNSLFINEVQEHDLQAWSEEPDKYWGESHEYTFTAHYNDIRVDIECSIRVDEYSNGDPYLQTTYDTITFSHPNGQVNVEKFEYTEK